MLSANDSDRIVSAQFMISLLLFGSWSLEFEKTKSNQYT